MILAAPDGPLRVANFRWFYLGESINTAGSSMSGIALAFAVLEISDSASALGLVVAASTVPMVAFMLIGGALADRLPRALVLRGCNLGQGILRTALAALVLTGVAEVWHLVALGLVSGTLEAVSYPAFHAMVPVLLPPEQRKAAFVLIGQTDSVLRIAGPAAAGILVAVAGPGWALAVDAATYVVAAGFLSLLRIPSAARPDRQSSVIGDFRVGWAFAQALGWVIPVASCSLVFNALISGSIFVLGPVIANDTIGSQGWGLAIAGNAVGIFFAGFALRRLTIRRPLRACLIGFTASALPMLVLGTRVTTLGMAAAFVVSGVGLAVINLAWSLTVQEKVPEEMLSRVQSIDGFFSFVAMPIGQLLVGPLILVVSIRSVELGSVVLMLLVMTWGLSRPVITRLELTGAAAAR